MGVSRTHSMNMSGALPPERRLDVFKGAADLRFGTRLVLTTNKVIFVDARRFERDLVESRRDQAPESR